MNICKSTRSSTSEVHPIKKKKKIGINPSVCAYGSDIDWVCEYLSEMKRMGLSKRLLRKRRPFSISFLKVNVCFQFLLSVSCSSADEKSFSNFNHGIWWEREERKRKKEEQGNVFKRNCFVILKKWGRYSLETCISTVEKDSIERCLKNLDPLWNTTKT